MHTGTFTFMPADINWIYDFTQNLYHTCPAHHLFEVNLVSWRLEISEVELTYDDTSDDLIIEIHYPAILQMVFANPQRKLLSLLFGLMMTIA